jgi:tRNA C32,U32 (ribose-2'-O)-methylase TrmJ
MLGNEGLGLSEGQVAACDSLVYIPQFSGATASLNVAVAGSIVLHEFAKWAGFQEANKHGGKFEVQQPRSKMDRFQNPTDFEAEVIAQKRRERMDKKVELPNF